MRVSRPGDRVAVSRTIIVVIVVVILVIAATAVYLAIRPGTTTGTSTTSSTGANSSSSSTALSSTGSASSSGSSSTSSRSTSSIISTTSSSSGSATGKQNITIELQTATGGLDPLGTVASQLIRWPQSFVYETPFTFNASTSSPIPTPWLATSYNVSSNAQLWTITLRQGIKFSDGTAFNATAIKNTVEDIVLANSGLGTSTFASFIRGAPAYLASNHNAANQSLFVNNDGITVLSPYSVRFNLSESLSNFLNDYMSSGLYPFYDVSPTALANNGGITNGQGNTWLDTHSAGTGPYMLSSYSSATGTIVLQANPNWWAISQMGVKQPFYQITINVVSNLATEELDIRTGVADFILLPTSNFFDFANRTAWTASQTAVSTVKGVSLWGPYPSPANEYFQMNSQVYLPSGTLATVQPFQNQNLIAAFNNAWNESAFIQSGLNGLGVYNPGVLVQGQLGYQNFKPYYSYNLTLAKQEITKACQALGCSPSNPLTITIIGFNDQTTEVAGSLMASNINSLQAGVNVVFEPLTSPGVISAFIAKSFQIDMAEQANVPSDPLSIPLNQLGSPTGTLGSHNGFNNATITALLNQAFTSTNVTQRTALYAQINQDLAQSGRYITLGQSDFVYASDSRVKVLPFNPWLVNQYPPIFSIVPA